MHPNASRSDAAIDSAPALDPKRVLQPTAKSKKKVPTSSEKNLKRFVCYWTEVRQKLASELLQEIFEFVITSLIPPVPNRSRLQSHPTNEIE